MNTRSPTPPNFARAPALAQLHQRLLDKKNEPTMARSPAVKEMKAVQS